MAVFPRHQCLIYEGHPEQHIRTIAETLVARLKAHYRCLYLNSPELVAAMRAHLEAAGFDAKDAIERGALVLSSDRGHLQDGRFDADRMIELLYQTLHQALADGYKGLWAAGDMSWEFGGEHNLPKLLAYERRLDDFLERNPTLSGVCLYHRDTLPADAIEAAQATHPAFYVGENLWEWNTRYQRTALS